MSEVLVVNVSRYETRVASLEGSQVAEVFIERHHGRGIVGNIYLGKVQRVLPGMQAAFVEIGTERAAFLYVGDVLPHEDHEEHDHGDPGDPDGPDGPDAHALNGNGALPVNGNGEAHEDAELDGDGELDGQSAKGKRRRRKKQGRSERRIEEL